MKILDNAIVLLKNNTILLEKLQLPAFFNIILSGEIYENQLQTLLIISAQVAAQHADTGGCAGCANKLEQSLGDDYRQPDRRADILLG
jgi:hypothetical protein